MIRRTRPVVAVALACLVVLLPAPGALAQAPTATTGSAVVTLRLELDGSLAVTEQLDVPEGATLERTVPLRTDAGDDRVRVLGVHGLGTDGPATVEVVDDELRVRAQPGSSTVRYVVDGALAAVGSGDELDWQVSGAGTALARVDVTVQVPVDPVSVSCRTGEPGASTACTAASSGAEAGGGVTLAQVPLAAGERLEAVVVLPAGAVPATARYEQTFSLGRAFTVSTPSVLGLAAVLLVLGGGALALGRLRGRDERAVSVEPGPVLPVLTAGGRTTFASPDGVLPGEVGTLVDERVDPVDVTATVLDLAVRGYLRVRVVPGGPVPRWVLDAAAEPDDALRPHERTLLDAVAGRPVDELGTSTRVALDRATEQLYDDVVAHGWFHRRPDTDRGRWTAVGLALVGAGAVLTVVLAATTTLALVGLGVLVGGVAVLVAARAAPARTARGAALVSQIGGLRAFLDAGDLSGVPAEHREEVAARGLPYAVVLDRVPQWAAAMAGVDAAADGAPGWSWLVAGSTDAARLTALTRALCAELDAAFTRAGHLRRLR